VASLRIYRCAPSHATLSLAPAADAAKYASDPESGTLLIYWPFDPTVYLGLLALFFGHAWLARGSADAERKHTLFFFAGLATLWLALETPIDVISDHYLDSVHMLQHVLLGFIAPPLMLLGLSKSMVARLVAIPGVREVTEPVPAQVFSGAVMVLWHVPAFYEATLQSESLHAVEHLMFIAGGVLLYWPVMRVTPAYARWKLSPPAKLLYLLVATIPQDGVALALLFSRQPFYEYYAHVARLVPSITAVIDQTLAGAVLMVLGKVAMAIAGLAIFFRWFGAEQREDRARLATGTN
jgi:putative membrane protein